jgi:ATP-dependent protease Clp ATPase subunit
LIPEIIGRLPVTHMDPLIEQHYVLTEPKKCVDQAVSKIILMDEVEFTITDEF